jgi:hypothetical protein
MVIIPFAVALLKISCLADFTPLLRLRFPFADPRSPASPLNSPKVLELQLIDHVIIGSLAPGAEQLLRFDGDGRIFGKPFPNPTFVSRAAARRGAASESIQSNLNLKIQTSSALKTACDRAGCLNRESELLCSCR